MNHKVLQRYLQRFTEKNYYNIYGQPHLDLYLIINYNLRSASGFHWHPFLFAELGITHGKV